VKLSVESKAVISKIFISIVVVPWHSVECEYSECHSAKFCNAECKSA
jgi:hypothetical protein